MIDYGAPISISAFGWKFAGMTINGSNLLFELYGSNTYGEYISQIYPVLNGSLIGSFSPVSTSGIYNVTNTSSFQYFILLTRNISDSPITVFDTGSGQSGFYIQQRPTGKIGLNVNQEFTISSDGMDGTPKITYTLI